MVPVGVQRILSESFSCGELRENLSEEGKHAGEAVKSFKIFDSVDLCSGMIELSRHLLTALNRISILPLEHALWVYCRFAFYGKLPYKALFGEFSDNPVLDGAQGQPAFLRSKFLPTEGIR